MIQAVITIVMGVVVLAAAEWSHYKSGNGKRFERIHDLIETNRNT